MSRAIAAPGTILLDGIRRYDGAGPERLVLAEGRIAASEAARGAGAPVGGQAAGRTARRFDGEGLFVLPGFIDLQVNGAAGHDLTADPEAIWEVGAALARFGVTAYLPTIVTSPPEVAEAARRRILGGPPPGYAGAVALGLHLEGPFLNPERGGAHRAEHLRPPDPALADSWSRDGGVALVTLAPELPGAVELVRVLGGRDVVVAAGHSLATVEEARAGFEAGIRYATHLFNAMPRLDHRAPGLAAAALADPRVIVGLIPDGLHVHPTLVDLAWRIAGRDRLSIVTDSIAALGMPPGRYPLGDADVAVDDDGARLSDGRLAGGVIGLDEGLRNLVAFTGASPADAAAAITGVPAMLLGEPERGRLAVGGRADIVVVDDQLEVVAAIVGGIVAHGAEADRWR